MRPWPTTEARAEKRRGFPSPPQTASRVTDGAAPGGGGTVWQPRRAGPGGPLCVAGVPCYNRDSFEMASEEQEKYKRIGSFFKLVEVTNDKIIYADELHRKGKITYLRARFNNIKHWLGRGLNVGVFEAKNISHKIPVP